MYFQEKNILKNNYYFIFKNFSKLNHDTIIFFKKIRGSRKDEALPLL
jgi:hypothetical protein